MPGWLKGILIALGLVAVLIVAGLVTGYVWISRHAGEMKQASAAAGADGRTFGATTDNAGCLKSASERAKSDTSSMITRAIAIGEYVGKCLEASRPTPNFCEGIPAFDPLHSRGTWMTQRCETYAIDVRYCTLAMQRVQFFCHPRDRDTNRT